MKKLCFLFWVAIVFVPLVNAQTQQGSKVAQVKISNGILQGVIEPGGIRSFKGIPYAQPPVGDLRWKEPQPPQNWKGIRKAVKFGPRAMQRHIWDDMIFRSEGISEDCLYLNVWTPAKSSSEKLPVLVYFHGGGFVAGDGSEYRYDGESMAKKGIVSITINYRMGIFGFLAHPALTQESPHHSSGNYGLLDQHAALVWVQKNIAAFGGDPEKVTIGGESAGSSSVSAQMASPLSKGLFVRAIAESGAVLGPHSCVPLSQAEQNGANFVQKIGVTSLSDLRKLSADSLLKLSAFASFPMPIDGYFFPESPLAIFSTGKQMDIPLLAGWNSAEVGYQSLLGNQPPTLDAYKNTLKTIYGDKAEDILKAYPAATDADVPQVATDLASDRFITYSTWKFIDVHGKTNGHPVYRYLFARKRPPMVNAPQAVDKSLGAVHASEIEYALGNLSTNKFYAWTPDDYKVSETMEAYFANFIKTGNPNGPGLSTWYGLQSSIPKVMIIDVNSQSQPEKNLKRYQLLDSFFNN
ncbi:MAG: carboxylesterase family protein [Bacteroidota bacterium]|nr:carboxylesterase family protein [Bacteroidota bacterium]